MVPEVAPGGNGTGICGKYRVAVAGRGAAVPVRRGARPVGACPAAGDRDGEEAGGVLAASGPVPFVRPDARAAAADLWSRRRYGAAVIQAVLVLAARAAGTGRPPARPFAAVSGGAAMVPGSTARSWRSRFTGRAAGLREQLARLLPLVSGTEAARPAVPSGSPSGDCLAVLEAVTAGLGARFPAVAGVSAHEVAAHLSGGRWLAPGEPVLEFSTSLFSAVAVSPS
jgi:hypothetical protein